MYLSVADKPAAPDISTLSDDELLDRCERYGREALMWRNKFRALLPEVSRRKLYLRKGFSSVHVFAMVLAGLSEAQVDESLNLAPRLGDKPALRELLESGAVSVNKIAKVISIATPDNQEALAEKVQILSTRALETFTRDIRQDMRQESVEAKDLHVKKPESKSQLAQMREVILPVDLADTIEELRRKGIDVEGMMRAMFAKREEEIALRKQDVAESLPEESSRHVPKRVKDIIKEEYGMKCAKEGCGKPSEQLHHTARYALTKSHDPHFLAPLCHEHHEIAHALDVKKVECSMVRKL